jgi:hypothetical protein
MLGKTSICSTLEASASIHALGGMFRTEQILANCGSTLIPLTRRTTMPRVSFLVHYFLPVFKYLFFVGLIGAVPVIIVTAVKTAQSMLEED